MKRVYIVLYTHQKTKKHKTWQDGELHIHEHNKGGLYDAEGSKIDRLS
jgi:hypothetical protein